STGILPAVLPDERAGATAVVEMLVARGHRRIAFAASAEDVPATRGRLRGYLEAMSAAGLPTEGLVAEGSSDARGGYAAANALLDAAP
ncbi:substrate-binding domain-containing protein, partial [Acinetobacter baumannii]